MNWGMFFWGLGLIVGAFLIRRFDRWFYGRHDAEIGSYNYFRWLKDKIITVFMVIMGLIIILVSFAP